MAFQFSEIIKDSKIMFPPHMTRKVEHHNRISPEIYATRKSIRLLIVQQGVANHRPGLIK